MSYTIFNRMCDAVDEALEGELDREVIERIWETEFEHVFDDFADAEQRLWDKVGEVIARHSNEVD